MNRDNNKDKNLVEQFIEKVVSFIKVVLISVAGLVSIAAFLIPYIVEKLKVIIMAILSLFV
jgi:hypothetical protein